MELALIVPLIPSLFLEILRLNPKENPELN